MKFIHLADCHLGGWRQPELSELCMQSFQKVIDIIIKEKADFVLIAGDLFDSAYPSIETLKSAFREFRKLREANIPVFIIAGSHDYSASGKSFLEVLEKAGFCINAHNYEEKDSKIILLPTLYKNVAIYGFPGKKSALEIEEIERIRLQDAPGLFKILMLHTTLRSAVPNPNVRAVDDSKLPKVDYIALGHLHITYSKNGKVYAGPLFPNNLQELEELKGGSFYIFNNGSIEKREIKLKEIKIIDYQTSNTLNATEEILSLLEKEYLKDKILILKVSGIVEQGRTADIDFAKIENYVKAKGVYSLLKSTSKLQLADTLLEFSAIDTEDIESRIIEKFEETNQSRFNHLIGPLIKILQIEKLDDERSAVFEERLLSETKKLITI